MNTEKIMARLANLHGISSRKRVSTSGIEICVPTMDGRYIVGLVPIDDESDDAFADSLARKVNQAVLKKWKR